MAKSASKKGCKQELAENIQRNHGSNPIEKVPPPIGVFWDIENCQVPKGKSAMAVVQIIRDKFFIGHREAEFMCVCDISKENKDVIQELNNAQVTVVHINATCKNAADDKLRQSMRRFADIHGHVSTIVLISSDVNFAADLSDFRHRRRLRVIVIHNNCAAEALLTCAHEHYSFCQLVASIPFRTPVKSNQSQFELLITNLPHIQNIQQLRCRLRQLSDNCGGRVLSINHGTAVIRFPTTDAAARARKRMDKENVFGNKISVVNFTPKSDAIKINAASPIPQAKRSLGFDTSRESSPRRNFDLQNCKSADNCTTLIPHNGDSGSIFPPPPDPTMYPDAIPSSSISPASYCVWSNASYVISTDQMQVSGYVVNHEPIFQVQPSVFAAEEERLPFPMLIKKPSWTRATSLSPSPQTLPHPMWKALSSAVRDEMCETASGSCSSSAPSRSSSTCSSDGTQDGTIASSDVEKMTKNVRKSRGKGSRSGGKFRGQRNSNSIPRSKVLDAKNPTPQANASLLHIERNATRPSSCSSTPSPFGQIVNAHAWKGSSNRCGSRDDHHNGGKVIGVSHPFLVPSRPSSAGSYGQFGSRTGSSVPLSSDYHFQPINQSRAIQDSNTGLESGEQSAPLLPVDLQVTNLDQNIDTKEMKQLLFTLFRQHVMVLHVSVTLNSEGSLSAIVRVKSRQDAQYAISQLHRRKIGYKRILISFINNSPSPMFLRTEVIALLSDVPGKKLPLFKFRELFENRYHQSIGVSELYKMKEIVLVQDDPAGRMVCLTSQFRETPSPATSDGSKEIQEIMEKCYCEIHCPNPNIGKGWAEQDGPKSLLNVKISLKSFAPQVHTLLQSHNGKLPLSSFPECYRSEIGSLEELKEGGVPLEHLIASVPGVQITQGLLGGGRHIRWTENKTNEQDVHNVSPPLANQIALFSREVVDLLKASPHCMINFNKFIPAYHHHFGRQCRVADYGYTRLIDLCAAIPHVIQVIGDGNRRFLTLTHRAQVRRFTGDLLRVLKSQASKQVILEELPVIYNKCAGREFDISNYGVCEVLDMLAEISETTFTITGSGPQTIIAIPKRAEQTDEEVEKTKQFSVDVLELLRHSPYCQMNFNKFIPAYHHHFGRQCRVADYGFTKLIELFEAIPELVEMVGEGDEKTILLSEKELLKVLAEQVVALIKSTKKRSVPLHNFTAAFTQFYGYSINVEDHKVHDLVELLEKIKNAVRIANTSEGQMVLLANREHNRQLSSQVQMLLRDHDDGIDVVNFKLLYEQQYAQDCDMDIIINELADTVTLEGCKNNQTIRLNPLYIFARNLHILLQENDGRLLKSQFDDVYLRRFGICCNPAQFGFSSLGALIHTIPEVAVLRGKSQKRTILLNKDIAGTLNLLRTSANCNIGGGEFSMPCRQIAENGRPYTLYSNKVKNDLPTERFAVPEKDEVQQIDSPPVDLLSVPVPSGIPSPVLKPLSIHAHSLPKGSVHSSPSSYEVNATSTTSGWKPLQEPQSSAACTSTGRKRNAADRFDLDDCSTGWCLWDCHLRHINPPSSMHGVWHSKCRWCTAVSGFGNFQDSQSDWLSVPTCLCSLFNSSSCLDEFDTIPGKRLFLAP